MQVLLIADGVINLILGLILLAAPLGSLQLLGLPQTDQFFYPSILGAVLAGIGLALFIEANAQIGRWRGLGLEGAISINFVGAGVLVLWLLFSRPDMEIRGLVLLWAVVIAVAGIGFLELWFRSTAQQHQSTQKNKETT